VTLTDTQLVLLSAAAQRDDHLITPPASLKGRAAHNVLATLIRRGLAEELPVSAHQPHWRTDDQSRPVGFRITQAGLAALGIDPADQGNCAALPDAAPTCTPPSRSAPKSGTKQELLLQLMEREQGATLEELIAATGWLPHTTRAALTGLRKKGYRLERTGRGAAGAYHVDAAAEEVR
jgi:hypothetical protein